MTATHHGALVSNHSILWCFRSHPVPGRLPRKHQFTDELLACPYHEYGRDSAYLELHPEDVGASRRIHSQGLVQRVSRMGTSAPLDLKDKAHRIHRLPMTR
jgi:hypothetical protein